jgi:hypothetical protein
MLWLLTVVRSLLFASYSPSLINHRLQKHMSLLIYPLQTSVLQWMVSFFLFFARRRGSFFLTEFCKGAVSPEQQVIRDLGPTIGTSAAHGS